MPWKFLWLAKKKKQQQKGGYYLHLGTLSIGQMATILAAEWRKEEPTMSTSFLSNTLISVLLVIPFLCISFFFCFLFFPSLIHFGVVAFDMCKWLSSVFRMIFFLSTGTFCFLLPSIVVPFCPSTVDFIYISWIFQPAQKFKTRPEFGALMLIFFGYGSGGKQRKVFLFAPPILQIVESISQIVNPFCRPFRKGIAYFRA